MKYIEKPKAVIAQYMLVESQQIVQVSSSYPSLLTERSL